MRGKGLGKGEMGWLLIIVSGILNTGVFEGYNLLNCLANNLVVSRC